MANATLVSTKDKSGVEYSAQPIGTYEMDINSHQFEVNFEGRLYSKNCYVAGHTNIKGKQYTYVCEKPFSRDDWAENQKDCINYAIIDVDRQLKWAFPKGEIKIDYRNSVYVEQVYRDFLVNPEAKMGEVNKVDLYIRVYGRGVSTSIRIWKNTGILESNSKFELIQTVDRSWFAEDEKEAVEDIKASLQRRFRM